MLVLKPAFVQGLWFAKFELVLVAHDQHSGLSRELSRCVDGTAARTRCKAKNEDAIEIEKTSIYILCGLRLLH